MRLGLLFLTKHHGLQPTSTRLLGTKKFGPPSSLAPGRRLRRMAPEPGLLAREEIWDRSIGEDRSPSMAFTAAAISCLCELTARRV